MAALLLAAAGLDRPEILAVRAEAVGGRPAVRVLASGPLGNVGVDRRDGDFAFCFEATAPTDLALPKAALPFESLALERLGSRVVLHVRVASSALPEVRSEGSLVTVLFGESPVAETSKAPDVEALYAALFPKGGGQTTAAPAAESVTPPASGQPAEGWHFGPLTVQPGVMLRYVDSDSTFLDTPQPTRVKYWEIEPRVVALSSLSVPDSRLSLTYGPHFRRSPNAVPLLEETSHFLDAALTLPAAASVWLNGTYHFSRGTIETREADPGGEYFFDLSPFRRNAAGLDFRTETAGRFDFVGGASLDRVRFGQKTGWFDNERRGAHAGLRYELTPSVNATLEYGYERIPPSDTRVVVESNGHSLSLRFDGEITPLMTGRVGFGYRIQKYPNAPVGGREFKGLTLDASVSRELAHGARLTLSAAKQPYSSGFEENAFYVPTSVQGVLTAPLPLSFSLSGGAGYQWNGYRTDAVEIGRPRKDRLFGWTVGLAREINRWALARVDYRQDRRTSNIPGFSTKTWSLIAQVTLALQSVPKQ